MKEMITRTISSVAKRTSWYALEGVFFEAKDRKLTLVGCDGYRLSMCSTEVSSQADISAVIPPLPLRVLCNILDDRDVHLGFLDDEHFLFLTKRITLIVQPLKGEYPNYRSVIPEEDGLVAVVPSKDLEAVVDATRTMHYAEFTFTKGNVKVKATGFDRIIPARYDGEEVKIAIDPDLLHAPLKPVKAKNVMLYIKDPTSAILLKEESNEEWTFVFMPCKLKD